MEDKTLICTNQDCGAEFVFTAGEQEFYAEKGFTEPKKCKPCRDAAKAARFNRNDRPARTDRPARDSFQDAA